MLHNKKKLSLSMHTEKNLLVVEAHKFT